MNALMSRPSTSLLDQGRTRGCPAAQTSLRSLRKLDCVPGMTMTVLILSSRGHARLPHEWDAGCCDRALDEAAAEHARLAFGRIVEHAGLARRHAVLAVEEVDLHAVRSPAQPGRLRLPRRAHLDEHLVPAG